MKKLFSLLLCLLFAVSGTIAVSAQGKDCTLTIIYKDDSTPISGAVISIYRVAELKNGSYVLCGDFASDPVKLDISTDSASNKSAAALYSYAVMNGRTALKTGTTNSNGSVMYEALDEGLYLVSVKGVLCGNSYYGMSSYLVTLPGIDAETRNVVYNIISMPKSKIISDNREKKTELHVMKVWDDDKKTHSPISVNVYCDGKLYQTVELNNDNGWRFIITNLGAEHDYVVAETSVPTGYVVSISSEDQTFVITNSPKSTTQETTTAQSETTTSHSGKTNVTVPATSSSAGSADNTPYSGGGSSDHTPTIYRPEETTNTGTDSKTGNGNDEELPNTGLLWWPVPVMAFAGLLFITVGIVIRKKKDEKAD